MNTTKKLQIGIIGYAGIEEYPTKKSPNQEVYNSAEQIGLLLAQKGATVVTGGKTGIMESAFIGAKKVGGTTVSVIKGNQRFCSNNSTDVEVLTGMAADGFDEFMIVMMCDALITVGGGAGTLQEIVIAYRNKKPIIVLEETGGWADKIIPGYLDERETVKACSVNSPEKAVEKAFELTHKVYE